MSCITPIDFSLTKVLIFILALKSMKLSKCPLGFLSEDNENKQRQLRAREMISLNSCIR